MTCAYACRAKSGLSIVWQEIVNWGKVEGKTWIFVFKSVLAVLLALGISLRLELNQPGTAMLTVLIVMQPQTGLVLAKSLYRIAGTLAGTVASMVLVGMFAQERVLFLLGLALWVGLCTAGATLQRNFKSYGFILAGYTAAMIGLPTALQPNAFFIFATTRASEIILGILCAAAVNDIICPQRLADTIVRTIQSHYTDSVNFLQDFLSGPVSKNDFDKVHIRLITNMINLESARGPASMEDPEVRARDIWLRKFNSEFMAAATTFHSLVQLQTRLRKSAAPACKALDALCASLGEAIMINKKITQAADEAHRVAQKLAAFGASLPVQMGKISLDFAYASDPQTILDIETAGELLSRFVSESQSYINAYVSFLSTTRVPQPPDTIRFSLRTDPMLALLAGGRTAVAILCVGAFWIASAWPSGISALMFTVITCALFSTFTDPSGTAKLMLYGAILAFIAVLVFKFFIMPSLDGFILLCSALTPFLLFGSYLCTNKKFGAIGSGFRMYFIIMLAPINAMRYDPMDFVNSGIAGIMGVAAVALIYGTFLPTTGTWQMRRMALRLRRQVDMACFDPLPDLVPRFESSTRDLLHKLTSTHQMRDRHNADQLEWMLSVLEIGRAVIYLRYEAQNILLPKQLLDDINKSIRVISDLYKRPITEYRSSAINLVTGVIESVQTVLQQTALSDNSRENLRRMLTAMHIIRTSLLDDDSILAATTGEMLPGLQGGMSYAS